MYFGVFQPSDVQRFLRFNKITKKCVLTHLKTKSAGIKCQRKEEYLRAQLEVEVDDAELALFLAIEVPREELERLGLGEVTNTRKRRGGRPILITTKWIVGERGGQAENLFNEPERRPTALERRKMFARHLEILVLKVMNNHCYSVNGANKVQLEGGPIGLKLSGALAKAVMLSWS